MAEVSALIRAGGQFGGVDLAVLTFVLLLEFLDAHVPRGLLRLGRGRTVVLGSHTSRIDTRTVNLHAASRLVPGARSRGGGFRGRLALHPTEGRVIAVGDWARFRQAKPPYPTEVRAGSAGGVEEVPARAAGELGGAEAGGPSPPRAHSARRALQPASARVSGCRVFNFSKIPSISNMSIAKPIVVKILGSILLFLPQSLPAPERSR